MHDGIDPAASACQQDCMVVDFLMGSSNILMVAQQGVGPPPQSLSGAGNEVENNLESRALRILGVQAVLECVTDQWCNSFISSLESIRLGVSRLAVRIDRLGRRFQINDEAAQSAN